MNKNPITVYWSPYIDDHSAPDWSFLYPKPTTLFSDYFQYKDKESKNHLFQCPASLSKFRKTLVFNCPMSFEYSYDYSGDNKELILKDSDGIMMYNARDRMLTIGPNFKLGLGYSFFADESLEVSFTSPFFHKVKYMESCSTIPGNFNIGSWYRPYSFEIQAWSDKGKINFVEGEPLFYAEFKTDRPIIVKRYRQTELLTKYSHASMATSDIFKLSKTLKSRYERFKSVGLREKVLHEINKNVYEEEYLNM